MPRRHLAGSAIKGLAAAGYRIGVVTDTHLSPEFGLTYRDIEANGFRIDRKVEMLLSADTDGRALFRLIEAFVAHYPQRAKAFTSLGQLRYLSCLRQVDAVVGNSSSGLAEVPSFKKGTINIGDRQRGRLKAASVIL